MYWRIPNVRQITQNQLFKKENRYKCMCDFLDEIDGEKYSEIDEIARLFFPKKEKNKTYFKRHIGTFFKYAGLIEFDCSQLKEGIVVKSDFLDEVYKSNSDKLQQEYINYLLTTWQFPQPQIDESRTDDIRKPYLIILKILIMLYNKNKDEAYLDNKEFYELFEISSPKNTSEITDEYINIILDKRKNNLWKSYKNNIYYKKEVGYYAGFLAESFIISRDKNDYTMSKDFMIGLKKEKDWTVVIDMLIRVYENQIFNFDRNISSDDRVVTTQFSRYIANKEKFKCWRKLYMSMVEIGEFKGFCKERGFYYEEELIRRFVVSLETKPFLILTGISGSGKTKIAELWIEYKKEKYNDSIDRSLHISVGSNWNDNKKLLGFKNILLDDTTAYNSTNLVKLIGEANKDEFKDYVVILDEMNLSHVERYFADFLSALESRSKEIKLPNGETIKWSENLKIIGTVNVDETTYMFSPKVLDRANVIEMNGKIPSEYINIIKESSEKVYKDIKDKSWFDEYIVMLDKIYEAVNQDFGFRVIDEVSKYIKINTEMFGHESFDIYFDEQICQKILPKLHGSKSSLKPKLDALQAIFSINDKYTLTNTKLEEMQSSVKKGYASFIGE